jgi:L-seryl-tRNA(Ser) seleniumtransferase
METGTRGDRYSHVVDLLRDLTGAEAALVVNNNAAAVLLALNTLAEGREAIVSRGELVEIGGMFRIPDVMLRAGVKMVEIGTTNRTHLADYRRALTDQTGLIAKIHPSNYRIEGFYREATVEELGRLAAEHNVPLFYDIGSGSLVDLARWGLPSEPTVQSAIQQGANLVVFSGDKLIGGPQCGMIVGKEELVSRCKRNPLVRALRPDKLTLAALQATLKLFRDPDGLPAVHPLYAMLAATVEQLNRKALNLKRKLVRSIGARGEVRIKTGFSVMGSGALPARNIPTVMVTLSMNEIGAQELGRLLRNGNPPIFTRIEDDLTCFDMRTIADDEIKLIADAVDRLGNND